MADAIRVGKISSVDYAAGTVHVAYPDKDGSVTANLPLLSDEYRMPEVGDMVLVLHLSNGAEAGVVLGRYWSRNNTPPEGVAGLYRKDLSRIPGEAVIRYDGSTLTIQCAHSVRIKASGDVAIDAGGDVRVNGTDITPR